MQLRQLINTMKYIDDTLEQNDFVALYRELVNSLNQARQTPTPQVTDNIVRLRKEIEDLHIAAEPDKLGYAQRKLYKSFGARSLLGIGASDNIQNIFATHSADPGGTATSINELIELTELLHKRVRTLIEGLGPLAIDEEIKLEEGKTSIQLFFEEAASINTMKELEENSERWNNTLMAFSRLTKVPSEDAKIITIEQGSFLIALSAISIVVFTIAKASNEILAIYERYLNIKKLALEATSLKLSNKKIASQIEKEARDMIDKTADDVTNKFMTEHGWTNEEKDAGEVRNAVSFSIKNIFKFVKDGGKIDIYESEDTSNETKEQLREAFSRIHAIEGTIEKLSLPLIKEKDNDDNEEF